MIGKTLVKGAAAATLACMLASPMGMGLVNHFRPADPAAQTTARGATPVMTYEGHMTVVPCAVRLYVDPSLPKQVQVAVKTAARHVTESSNFTIDISPEAHSRAIPVTVTQQLPQDEVALAQRDIVQSAGTTSLVTTGILVSSESVSGDSRQLTTTMIHELAHVFGVEHSTDERSIMFATVNDATGLNKSDRAALKLTHQTCV